VATKSSDIASDQPPLVVKVKPLQLLPPTEFRQRVDHDPVFENGSLILCETDWLEVLDGVANPAPPSDFLNRALARK